MLEELIETHAAPRSLVVVSSDHRVQRAARRRGAAFRDSDQWYAERKAARRWNRDEEGLSQKPVFESTPEQVEFWIKKFSDPSSATAPDDVDEVFPPGYAEDLLE